MRRTARALVLTLALAVLLAGCHPPTLTKVRGWPGATPVFASEEEALAAAEEAYGEYLATSDAIAQAGGADPERLQRLVTADWYQQELATFALLEETDRRLIGTTRFFDMRLQSSFNQSRSASISAYVCIDFSGTSFVNSAGEDVTPSDRPDVVPFEVNFLASLENVLIAGSAQWSGTAFC